jgi:hypothetical protein
MIYYQTIDFLDVAAKDIVFFAFQCFFLSRPSKDFLGMKKKTLFVFSE